MRKKTTTGRKRKKCKRRKKITIGKLKKDRKGTAGGNDKANKEKKEKNN